MWMCRFFYYHKNELIEESKKLFGKLREGVSRRPPRTPEEFDKYYETALRTPEEFNKYYEPILEDKQLNTFLKKIWDRDRDNPGKYFLTGHPGVGKTTVINRLSQLGRDSFCVVTGSVRALMSDADPDYRDVLLLIAFLLVEKLNSDFPGVEIVPILQHLCAIIGKKDDEENPAVICALFKEVRRQMWVQKVFRGHIRACIENKQSDLLACIDQLHDKFKNCSKKPLLVIIDDLDKIDTNLSQAFPDKASPKLAADMASLFKNWDAMCAPKFDIIYTLPFSLYYSNAYIQLQHYYDGVIVVPIVNVRKKNNEINTAGVKKLKKLVVRRIPINHFKNRILDELIYSSGGNIGDLVDLLHRCCDYVIENPEKEILWGMTRFARTKIDSESRKNVVAMLRRDLYRLLNYKMRAQLRKLSQTCEPDSINPEALCFFIKENLALEQRTPDIWFMVHPLTGDWQQD